MNYKIIFNDGNYLLTTLKEIKFLTSITTNRIPIFVAIRNEKDRLHWVNPDLISDIFEDVSEV